MKHLCYEKDYSDCLIYSAAMVFNVRPDEIYGYIGHDGSEICWPEAEGPFKRRGHHIQEIIDFGIFIGVALTPIEIYPSHSPGPEFEPLFINKKSDSVLRFLQHITDKRAIIITPGHAIAWDGIQVLDPGTQEDRDLNDYQIQEAWIANQIR